MAIVSFWSNSKRETGQTLSSVAIATSMSINHNYKVLEIATGFMDKTIDDNKYLAGIKYDLLFLI